MELKVGVPYIITKSSDDGTFEKGDHIKLADNGDILCREAGGWIDQEDVGQGFVGMLVEVDTEALDRKKQALQDKLKELNDL
jgi:hypothetical protein